MIKIAHRGNTNGPSIHENQLWYIQKAIDNGYHAEIDLWLINNKLWAGHDSAQYLVNVDFLRENKMHLWIHCKNLEALEWCTAHGNEFNFFWHETDKYAMTSYGFIWTYPGENVSPFSVIVDLQNSGNNNCHGICSDYFGG